MLQYMLDTNICIYVLNERPPTIARRFDRLAQSLCISSITLGELYYGVERSELRAQNLAALEALVGRIQMLPFAGKAAAHYGEIRATLAATGKQAGTHDMLIGGHARSEGLIVVTNNEREFARMPGVRVENWLQ